MSKDRKQKRGGAKSRKRIERRKGALPKPLPHRRPTINDKKRASCLSHGAEFADALKHHRAELRKSRLKLDEIVHLLNAGIEPDSITNIIESAVEECRMTFAKGRETLDDFKEVFAMDAE